MPKVNLRYIQLTPADAGEALDTIARLEGQGRGVIAARLMEGDPHEPPRWWHVRDLFNLTLLARAAAAQEGTAPRPGNPPPLAAVDEPIAMAAALLRLKAKLNKWRDGTEPVPLALLPTYEGQTWIDIERLDYDPGKPDPHPDAWVDEEALYHMRTSLIELLEEIHPTEETFHGPRCYICYDESDPNVRVAPDYYFAKGVPGPGIKATGPYLIWAVGKPLTSPGTGLPAEGAGGPDHQAEALRKDRHHGVLARRPHWRTALRGAACRRQAPERRIRADTAPQARGRPDMGPQRSRRHKRLLDRRHVFLPGCNSEGIALQRRRPENGVPKGPSR